METRERGDRRERAEARARESVKETPRQRHDRLMSEVDRWLSEIDEVLAFGSVPAIA